MSDGFSIIKIDDISKPATVLIEKISNAVGGYFKPYQIRRLAKAEAEADRINAESQIEITDLHRRALTRFIAEEAKRQDNIENITEKSIPLLSNSSTPQDMEDDWITNFFDKCRIVSDDDMQTLWARVLAGEANSPGTYSKRTVNLLGSLDKADAQLFTNLCGFVWDISNTSCPLIYNVYDSIYNDLGINFGSLTHLDDIGLISFNDLSGFQLRKLPQHILASYYKITLEIEFKRPDQNDPDQNDMEIGRSLFTKTGGQLSLICESQPIEGFYDYVIESWRIKGLSLSSPIHHKK